MDMGRDESAARKSRHLIWGQGNEGEGHDALPQREENKDGLREFALFAGGYYEVGAADKHSSKPKNGAWRWKMGRRCICWTRNGQIRSRTRR